MSADQLDLFAPTARATDIDTAHRAAVIAIGRAATNRRLALDALYDAPEPLSDFDLERVTGVRQTSIGVRRGECVKAGLVCRAFLLDPVSLERVPLNGVSPSGAACSRWELTPEGRDLVASWRAEAGAA